MGGEWKTLSLRDAGVRLLDCDHRTPKETLVGRPYVTIPQMRGGEINLASARRISELDFVEWTQKARPQKYDVVLSRRCNPGETAHVRAEAGFALGQNLVLLRSDGSLIAQPFLRWITRGPAWWDEVERYRNQGAVFDSLKCADIVKFKIRIPSLPEQLAIADLLGPLDDKIELNRRLAETLEEQAQALFKRWFVDFGPVSARAEGRPTGLPDDLATLFPARFGDGGLPEGWYYSTVGEMFEISGGNTPSTSLPENWDGSHDWATPKDLSEIAYPVLLETGRRLTDTGLARSTSGLLPSGSVLLSSRAPIGYMAFASNPVAINQGFAGIVKRTISTAYAWCWCAANMDVIRGNAGGSTFPEISKSVFRGLPMLRPAEPVLNAFDVASAPMIARIVAAANESQNLAALRDALLPKVISGELRIRDAEQTVAAA